MCLELFCRDDKFKIFIDGSERFALYCSDQEIAVHVWPPAMLGHKYRPPATRATGMEVLDERILKGVWCGHLFVHAHATTVYMEIPPVAV